MAARRQAVIAVPVLLVALFSAAWGQATASLSGRVTDPSGAAIPAAAASLANAATGLHRSARADAQGVYQFLAIPPGTYTLTVTARGFAPHVQPNLQLLVNVPATVNVTLGLAATTTSVEVQGTVAPLLNTTDASMGNAFNKLQVTQLPIADRNVVQLLSLQPGVTYMGLNNLTSNFDTRSGAVDGLRSDQSNVTLDGVDVNDQNNGYAFTSILNVPPDSLQEFRVTTVNANATAGHSGGAQVALVTKHGTNQFHGSVYEFNRDTAFSANDFFLKTSQLENGQPNKPPQLIRNVYGFTLGGPVEKNRLFFFLNYEGRQDREAESVERTVPSAMLRQGFISYIGDTASGGTQVVQLTPQQLTKMDPLHIGPDPAILKYFQQYPEPNDTVTVGDGYNFEGYRFAASIPAGYDTEIARLDYNLTADGSEMMFWRGQLQNFKINGAPQFPGQQPGEVTLNDSRGSILGITSVLSPTLLNSMEWGYIRQGVENAGSLDAPYIYIRNLDSLYAPDYSDTAIIPVNNFNDNLSWEAGNHTFQFGTDINWVRDNRDSTDTSFSSAGTNADWVNSSGFANKLYNGQPSPLDPTTIGQLPVDANFENSYDFPLVGLMGLITEGDAVYNYNRFGQTLPQGTPVLRNYQLNEYEIYGQDQWRLTPNLTFTYGLRWTYEQPPWEINGNQVTPCVTATLGGTCRPENLADWFNETGALAKEGKPASDAGEISFALGGPKNAGPGYWNPDKSDFAPRLALAWAPDFGHGWLSKIFGTKGTVSIRGGYSIMYDHFGAAVVNSFDQNGAVGLSTDISDPAGYISVATAPRFTGFNNLPPAMAANGQPCTSLSGAEVAAGCIFGPAPPGGFPAPAPQAFAIAWGLDSSLKTPYAHEIDFSIDRQLTPHTSLQVAYVGTIGRRLMMQDDLAMPADLVDPKTGMDYFTAARTMTIPGDKGTNIQSIQPVQYWQDLYSNLASQLVSPGLDSSGNPLPPPLLASPCVGNAWNYGPLNANGAQTYVNIPTVTQYIYSVYSCNLGNETTALFDLDLPGGPTSNLGPYAYYHDQYSSLYAWRSIGTSDYNALQVSYKANFGNNLEAQFNYVWSKSLDEASDASRIAPHGGLSGLIVNAWDPMALRGLSDFNTFDQINANWVWALPFGAGQHYGAGAHGLLNALIGGWRLSGDWRWTTGFPVNVDNGYQWPTNWEIEGNANLVGALPVMQTTDNWIDSSGHGHGPNMFPNPQQALAAFRADLPGESGVRNVVQTDGFFNIDADLAKDFTLAEGKTLELRWSTFNVTNTVRYDAWQNEPLIDQSSSFGNYSGTLTSPRFMQFGLRFTF